MAVSSDERMRSLVFSNFPLEYPLIALQDLVENVMSSAGKIWYVENVVERCGFGVLMGWQRRIELGLVQPCEHCEHETDVVI